MRCGRYRSCPEKSGCSCCRKSRRDSDGLGARRAPAVTLAAQTVPRSLYRWPVQWNSGYSALQLRKCPRPVSPTVAHFRARNTGTTAVVVANSCGHRGFQPIYDRQYIFPALHHRPEQRSSIRFLRAVLWRDSCDLQRKPSVTLTVNGAPANGINLQLAATAIPAPVLTVAAPCAGPSSTGSINFGNVQQGSSSLCTFSI